MSGSCYRLQRPCDVGRQRGSGCPPCRDRPRVVRYMDHKVRRTVANTPVLEVVELETAPVLPAQQALKRVAARRCGARTANVRSGSSTQRSEIDDARMAVPSGKRTI